MSEGHPTTIDLVTRLIESWRDEHPWDLRPSSSHDLARHIVDGLGLDGPHIVDLTEQGWTLEHPYICRRHPGGLAACWVHSAVAYEFRDGPTAPPGRYKVDLSSLRRRSEASASGGTLLDWEAE